MGCTSSTSVNESQRKPLCSYELKGEWVPEEKAMFDGISGMMGQMPEIVAENIPAMRDMSK